MGIEPTTHRLTAGRSTAELHSNKSARKESNLRPSGYKPEALPLRYVPILRRARKEITIPPLFVRGKLYSCKRPKPFAERYMQDLNLHSISAGLVSNQLRYHYGNVPVSCLEDREKNQTRFMGKCDHPESTMPDLNRPYFCLEDRCHSQLGEWCRCRL